MKAATPDRLLSVRDTARALGCSVATVWRRTADHTLPQPIKIGGTTRWPESEIITLIEDAKAQRNSA